MNEYPSNTHLNFKLLFQLVFSFLLLAFLYFSGHINIWGASSALSLLGLTLIIKNKTINTKSFLLFIHVMLIVIAALHLTHLANGFFNIKIYDQIYLTEDSAVYTMYLNFDKLILGLFILIGLGVGVGKKIKIKTVFITYFFCALTLMASGLILNYIKLDIKWPEQGWVWCLNNLFIVCLAEEVFFRRYLQDKASQLFSKFKYSNVTALFIVSLIYGAFHFKGGYAYIGLSTIAGLFYGYAYMKTQRIESAILVHFLTNLTHFIFFSYPKILT